MANQWYCMISGHERGPLSSQQLKAMATKGRLQPDHLVRQGTEGSWVPASRVKGLFATAGPAAPSDKPTDSDSAAVLVAKPLEEPPAPPTAKPSRVVEADASGTPPGGLPPVRAAARKAKPAAQPAFDAFGIATENDSPAARVAGKSGGSTAGPKNGQRKNLMLVVGLLVVIGGLAVVGIVVALSGKGRSASSDTPDQMAANTKTSEEVLEEIDELDLDRPKNPDAIPSTAAEMPSAESSAGSGEAEWANASGPPVQRGEVKVKIVSAEVGRPTMKRSSGRTARPKLESLVIRLELENVTATKKLKYASWSVGSTGVSLVDNFDNEYRHKTKKTFQGASIEGQFSSGSIYPGKSVKDALAFEPPVDKAEYLRLRLPAMAFGESGVLRFEIPTDMIKEIAEEDEEPSARDGDGSDTKPASPEVRPPGPAPPERPEPAIERGIEELEQEKKDDADGKSLDQPVDDSDKKPDDDPDGDVSQINKDIEALGGGDKEENEKEHDFEKILKGRFRPPPAEDDKRIQKKTTGRRR